MVIKNEAVSTKQRRTTKRLHRQHTNQQPTVKPSTPPTHIAAGPDLWVSFIEHVLEVKVNQTVIEVLVLCEAVRVADGDVNGTALARRITARGARDKGEGARRGWV